MAHKRDFPDYFNLFSRIRTHAGLREVANSARRMLGSIQGIRGAKYGFTRAAGFNGAVYVQRRDKQVVTVVFGARSTATLVKRINKLVDDGFAALD